MQKYGIRVNRGRIATHQGIGRNEKDQWDGGADDCLPSRKLCSEKGR